MVGHVVDAGVRLRVLIVILAVAASAFGALQLTRAPIEPVPEFAPVTVEVQAEALGLSAQEVEDLVTVPLESNLLSGIAWVDHMRSASIPGLSSIVMTFEEGTDPIRARQVVQERLTQGALLTNASKAPVMLQPVSAANRVMMIGLSSQDQSLVDLSVLSRWTIRPKLMSVQGVANVSVWGMRDRQLHVQADPARMQERDVSLDELVATTGNALWVSPLSFLEASTPGRGGFLDLPQQRVNVQHISPITDNAALGRVVVEGTDGKVVLSDVADIVEAPPTIIGDGIVGDASALVLVVEKQPGVSTAEVSEGIEEALASLSVGLPGVTMDPTLYRPADYVADAGRNLALAGALALLLVAAGSALIYRAWRPVVSVIATVTLAVLGGWLLLWLRAEPLNLVALTGLAAGAILAIGQAASAASVVAQAPPDLTPLDRVGHAYSHAGVTAVYTAVAVALMAVPAFLLAGRAGAFLPEIAIGVLAATAGALLVALLVAPAIAALIGAPRAGRVPQQATLPAWGAPSRNGGDHAAHRGTVGGMARRFSSASGRLAASAVALVAVVVVGIGASAALAVGLGVDTRPSFQERSLVLEAVAPEGTSPQALARILAGLSGELRQLDGVAGVGGHLGRAVSGERIVGANSGELWITLDDGADRDAVAGRALAAARAAGDLDPSVRGFLDGRVDRILPDADGPLVVSVYGPEPEPLRASADEVLKVVSGTAGVTGARLVEPPTEDNIQITVDLAKAEALGMTPGDVRRQAATLVGGLEVGAIFEQQKVFDVQVWSGEQMRNSPEKVRALPIDTPDGTQVPLGEVASVVVARQPTVIDREAVQRRLDIVADSSSGAVRDAVAASLGGMTMPTEYHAEVRTEGALIADNQRNVLLYAVAAGLGMLLLLQAATRNWWTAVAAMGALPLGLSGGLVAALIIGDLTVGALAGLLALVALGVHNALTVLRAPRVGIDDRTDLRAAAGAVLPATGLTFLVGLGVAVLGGRAGLEGVTHVALVAAGGAVTTGLVALVVLPAVALRYGQRVEAVEDLAFDDAARLGLRGVGAHA